MYSLENFAPVLAAFQLGSPIIVMDDDNRENEGDLIIRADAMDEVKMQLFLQLTTAYICLAMDAESASKLELPQMTNRNHELLKTAFTVTFDGHDSGTGVSAESRTKSIKAACTLDPKKLVRPGHTNGLVARWGGVLERRGHTEAAIDLCRLTNSRPLAVICELQDRQTGLMLRLDDCQKIAKNLNVPITTVEVISQLMKRITLPERPLADHQYWGQITLGPRCRFPNRLAGALNPNWELVIFNGQESHAVLKYGELVEPVLVRIHSKCFTGDTLHSARCDCGEQLAQAARAIEEAGSGLILYLNGEAQEGRGIGLSNKIKCYALQQEKELNTYEAGRVLGFEDDSRNYHEAHQILDLLGVKKIILISNNPDKISHFEKYKPEIRNLDIIPNPHNQDYLAVKHRKHTPSYRKEPPVQLLALDRPLDERSKLKIAIVKTAWNHSLVDEFVKNLTFVFQEKGVTDIPVYQVPGVFELAYLTHRVASQYDAVLCVGVIMQGETSHFQLVSEASTRAILEIGLGTKVPVIDGILACASLEQVNRRICADSVEVQSLPLTTIHMASIRQGWLPLVSP